jgi:hypothetical protein
MKALLRNMFICLSIIFGANQCLSMDDPQFRRPPNDEIPTVTIRNPCFPRYSDKEFIPTHNGDLLGCSANGVIGKFIEYMSRKNDVQNPNHLTHVVLCVHQNPLRLFQQILRLTPSEENNGPHCRISPRAGREMQSNLCSYHGDTLALVEGNTDEMIFPFALESNGTAGQVIRGIFPCVQISPLALLLTEYDGRVYQRPITVDIPMESTTNFLEEHLGRPYEGSSTFHQLFRAVNGENEEEDIRRLYCSETAALYYRERISVVGWRAPNVSNILPEHFNFGIPQDVLGNVAGQEIALKW